MFSKNPSMKRNYIDDDTFIHRCIKHIFFRYLLYKIFYVASKSTSDIMKLLGGLGMYYVIPVLFGCGGFVSIGNWIKNT